MLSEIIEQLSNPEGMDYSVVVVAITFLALVGAFGVRSPRFKGREIVLSIGCALIFGVIFLALELVLESGVGYWMNIWLTLAAAILFSLAFVDGSPSESLALIVSCVFSIIIMRSTLTAAYWYFGSSITLFGDHLSTVFQVMLYVCAALVGIFYLSYPVRPSALMPRSSRYLLLAIPTCTVIISQSQIALGTMTAGETTQTECLFDLVSLVSILTSYYLTCQVTHAYAQFLDEQQINQRLELSLDHVQRSGAIVEQVRRDKHEMKNMFLYMQALCNDGRYDELSDFLNRQMPQHFDELTEFHTGNNTLDYLLTQKASEARQAGAQVCFDVLVPAEMDISDRDLCGLLGNLLDNAIDASRKEVEAGRDAEVRLSIQAMRGFLFVQTKNRCSQDVLQRNPHLQTTKANAAEHGIGIKVVKSLVHDHDGSFKTTMEDGNFVATALLAL